MRVFTVKSNPTTKEISQVLAKEFSSQYKYRFFGLDKNGSIIVRKSEFVGAQVSKSGNQITVHAMSPNLLLSFLDPLSGLHLLGAFFYRPLKKLESDLVTFLREKYA